MIISAFGKPHVESGSDQYRGLKMKKDVIVIGGGAAGLFCALTAGGRGRSVLVIEHAETIGKKILISGGGRCNFTNLYTAPENFRRCDEGNYSFVYKQPENEEERALCEEAFTCCPVEAIGNDG